MPLLQAKLQLASQANPLRAKKVTTTFYQLVASKLKEVGLIRHPTSPCIFSGSILPNHPPLYLGLYIDDFVYFSESPAVEKEFEQ
mmetsp:Transcript_14765/g.21090  ORF Transcript_14765/g.21090 Transcript_14765/m.21090 type:complete len:85 (+) Transcript_14765:1301-1555(+)